jgi:hypothetical protein
MEYKQIIQNALDVLKKQLEKFLELKLRDCYGDEFYIYMENGPKVNPNHMIDINIYNSKTKYKDVLYYLSAFIKNWEFPFKNLFSNNYSLTLCHSIKYFRNRWAHQSVFTLRETYRLMDEGQALLEELNMDHSEIEIIRKSVLEMLVEEEVKNKKGETPKLENNSFSLFNNVQPNVSTGSQGYSNLSNNNNGFKSYNNFGNSNQINSNSNNPDNRNQQPYNYDADEFMIDVGDDKDLLEDINYQKFLLAQYKEINYK